mmetsp:Transcript_16160/g.30435  ORF Transcript_16160/g.30435 Transcript_16160/m.30435 type:complete len:81 (-) Transcript_16160:182-424(-)
MNDMLQKAKNEIHSECVVLRQNWCRAASEASRWKGKYEEVQKRNVELTEELNNTRSERDDARRTWHIWYDRAREDWRPGR